MKKTLVKIKNKQIVTDSRQVAEHFEKAHKHVLDSIRQILVAENSATKFFMESEHEYRGQKVPMYYMNRDGFTLLAMGFTGKKALEWKLKYINAFNEMEAKLKAPSNQPSYQITDEVERAKRWIEEAKERKALMETTEKQRQVIGELKPKADYVDRILQSKSLVTITQIAKDYGMSGMAMNAKLHELGIQYKAGKQWLLYSKYHALGYTSSKTIEFIRKDGTPDVNMQTAWTQKGRLFLYDELKKVGVLPMIEWKDSEKEAV